jgi:hypothetical protein
VRYGAGGYNTIGPPIQRHHHSGSGGDCHGEPLAARGRASDASRVTITMTGVMPLRDCYG